MVSQLEVVDTTADTHNPLFALRHHGFGLGLEGRVYYTTYYHTVPLLGSPDP